MQEIPGYKTVEKIGEGLSGEVYLAEKDGRHFAVKVLKNGFLYELISEYFILQSIKHPNIVRVINVNAEAENPYVVFEYAEKGNLMDRDFSSDVMFFLKKFTSDILPAVEVLHSRGIIHGDIKPSNILVFADYTLKLSDLGGSVRYLKTVSFPDSTTLTLEYTSPEVLRGERLSPQSDIYSLGVLLFEMLTGELPFQGTPDEVINGHLVGSVPSPRELNPEIPMSVANLILKMLEKSPLQRPGSVKEIMEILKKIVASPETSISYISSKEIIGRDKELRIVENLFKRILLGGKTGKNVIIFSGPEGIGKSFLAEEIVNRAHLSGIFPIKLDFKSHGYAETLRKAQEFLEKFLNRKLTLFDVNITRGQIIQNLYEAIKLVTTRFPVLVVIDELPLEDRVVWGIASELARKIRRDRAGIVIFSKDGAPQSVREFGRLYQLQPLSLPQTRFFLRSEFPELQETLVPTIYEFTRGNPKSIIQIARCLINHEEKNCFVAEKTQGIKKLRELLNDEEWNILRHIAVTANPVDVSFLANRFEIKKLTDVLNKLLENGVVEKHDNYIFDENLRNVILSEPETKKIARDIARQYSISGFHHKASKILYNVGFYNLSFKEIEPLLRRAFRKRNFIKLYDILRYYEGVKLSREQKRNFIVLYAYTLINLGMHKQVLKLIEDNYQFINKARADFLRSYALRELDYPPQKLLELVEQNVLGKIKGFLKDEAEAFYIDLLSNTNIDEVSFMELTGRFLKKTRKPDLKVKILRITGNFNFRRDKLREALRYYKEGLKLAKKFDIHWEIPNLLMNFSVTSMKIREISFEEHLENLKNVVRFAEKQANYPVLEAAYINLFLYYLSFKKFDEAKTILEKLKLLGETTENSTILAEYYDNMAYLYFESDEWESADEYFNRAYSFYRQYGVPPLTFYDKYSRFLVHRGEFRKALRIIREAISEWKNYTNISISSSLYRSLLVVLSVVTERDYFSKFLKFLPRDVVQQPSVAYFINFHRRDFESALRDVDELIKGLTRYGKEFGRLVYIEKAEALYNLGRVDEAEEFIKEYIEAQPENSFRLGLAYVIMTKINLKKNQWDSALRYLDKAEEIFNHLGAKFQLAKVRCYRTYLDAIFQETEIDPEKLKECHRLLNELGAIKTFHDIELEILNAVEK